MKDYLFYVKYRMSGIYIYHCKTDDPFHVMGEMIYRRLDHTARIDFVEQTENTFKLWDKRGYKIREWKNEYDNFRLCNKEAT